MYKFVPAYICKHFIPTLLPLATDHKMFGLSFYNTSYLILVHDTSHLAQNDQHHSKLYTISRILYLIKTRISQLVDTISQIT